MHPRYKRMLKGLEKQEKSRRKGRRLEPWFLYLLRCADGSLYTGITNDLDRRVRMHQEGNAAKYTRTRRPVALVYSEKVRGRSAALIRECRIKSFPKKKKESLAGNVQTS
ncbi:MAG: GIY-YIG nuclease family protein [Candidatus Omnitrophota bacterium]|jgi:predicted GIY-YIG superfamily endonuclease